MACHNFLHEKSTEILSALYKGLFFVMRAKYYCESGVFVRKKSELISLLPEDERLMLDAVADVIKKDFDKHSKMLIEFSGCIIKSYVL